MALWIRFGTAPKFQSQRRWHTSVSTWETMTDFVLLADTSRFSVLLLSAVLRPCHLFGLVFSSNPVSTLAFDPDSACQGFKVVQRRVVQPLDTMV